MELQFVDAGYGDEVTAALIDEIQAEMTVRYGGPDESPVHPGEFEPPSGAFMVATVDGAPIGCVGLRRIDDEDVELKRMYVREAHRRRGHARALLAAAEDRARLLGFRRILLETGLAQPEAIALYEAQGYERVSGFGHYQQFATARSYAKVL